jgi:hypothetical protein
LSTSPATPPGTDTKESVVNTTTSRRTATAGLCAAAAGAIFVGVQINHPPADVAHLVTTEMTIRMTAKVLFCALALAGLAGMFARHRDVFGRLGCAGYGLVSVGFLAMLVQECLIGYYLPSVAHSKPVYAQHVLNGAMAHGASSGIGAWQGLFLIAGMGYSLGGLLFGITLFRVGVLSRSVRLPHHFRTRTGCPAGVLQPPVRSTHRRCADRSRRLAVAK